MIEQFFSQNSEPPMKALHHLIKSHPNKLFKQPKVEVVWSSEACPVGSAQSKNIEFQFGWIKQIAQSVVTIYNSTNDSRLEFRAKSITNLQVSNSILFWISKIENCQWQCTLCSQKFFWQRRRMLLFQTEVNLWEKVKSEMIHAFCKMYPLLNTLLGERPLAGWH